MGRQDNAKRLVRQNRDDQLSHRKYLQDKLLSLFSRFATGYAVANIYFKGYNYYDSNKDSGDYLDPFTQEVLGSPVVTREMNKQRTKI